MFVISCLQGGSCLTSLEARRKGVETINIGPLDMMERTELVRRLLRKHRKVLDESAFNNQVRLLIFWYPVSLSELMFNVLVNERPQGEIVPDGYDSMHYITAESSI